MSGSSVDRNNKPDEVPRASRRRKIDTTNTSNATTFWASEGQDAASQSTLPPTIGTNTTDRSRHARSGHAEDYDRTQELPPSGNVGFAGRNYYRQFKEISERRPDPATMAPHSSGALFPPWAAGRGAETRVVASHREAVRAPNRWREGGVRASSAQRRGILGDGEEEYNSRSGRGELEWDPYPEKSLYNYGDDDGQESAERVSENLGVYKSARSKRRMSRSRRTRAGKGSSLGDKLGAVTGLDGGWAREYVTGERTSGFS